MQIPPSVKRKRRKNLAAYVDPLAPAPTGDKPMGNIIIIIIIMNTSIGTKDVVFMKCVIKLEKIKVSPHSEKTS